MGWVRELVKALLPTVVFPALVAGLILYRFGLTTDSVVAILIFTQLYVAWAEVEVALRQTYLARLEYEPVFTTETRRCMIVVKEGEVPRHQSGYVIKIRNVGRYTAWNILILVSIKPSRELGKETYMFKSAASLAPREAIELDCISEETFDNSEIEVELDYETIHGEERTMIFVKYSGPLVFTAVTTYRKPGVLLNSFEELSRILATLTLQYKIHKIRKYQEKNRKGEQEKPPNKQYK